MDANFKELSKEEIVFRLKKHDLWKLEDITLFVFGYEHQGVDWDCIIDTNTFPVRQYYSALQATNDTIPKEQLKFVIKTPHPSGGTICHVKKGPFIMWAHKKWSNEPRVEKIYNIWRNYKNQIGSNAPSLQTPKAIIKNCGDEIQIKEYIAHIQTGSLKPYKANLTKIAKQVKAEIKKDFTINTYKTYLKRMSREELVQHIDAI